MKRIPLTRGQFALVDDEDYEELSKHSWYYHSAGYATRKPWDSREKSSPKQIFMHRVVMNTPKGMATDHINQNKLDNRKENLRICTRRQNSYNQGKKASGTSIYKGVWKCGFTNQWVARVGRIWIGRFKTEELAALAYDLWAVQEHGEYAYTNFPVVSHS